MYLFGTYTPNETQNTLVCLSCLVTLNLKVEDAYLAHPFFMISLNKVILLLESYLLFLSCVI